MDNQCIQQYRLVNYLNLADGLEYPTSTIDVRYPDIVLSSSHNPRALIPEDQFVNHAFSVDIHFHVVSFIKSILQKYIK